MTLSPHHRDDPADCLARGRAALAAGDAGTARRLAARGLAAVPRDPPPGPDGALGHALGQLAAQAHRALGDPRAAAAAADLALSLATRDPDCLAAADALLANDLPTAEAIARRRLKADPTELASLQLLAQVGARAGRLDEAVKLLAHAHALCPDQPTIRINLAGLYYRQHRFAEVEALLRPLPRTGADDPGPHAAMRAAALGRIGGYAEARAIYAALGARDPANPGFATSEGHIAKTLGDEAGAVAAYRRAIAVRPDHGEAWWSLANIKTVAFDDADRAALTAALALPAPPPPVAEAGGKAAMDDRAQLLFAAARAAEDAGEDALAFERYAAGNGRIAPALGHDPVAHAALTDRAIALAARLALPDPPPPPVDGEPVPIFIVGLPRSGSTLLEQMLSCHPAIEGTVELADLPFIAGRLSRAHGHWLDRVAVMDDAEAAALGAEYLRRTRVHRRLGRAMFIDKLPNNWLHAGLIRRILPHARIIEARRDPRDCGWSCYRQHFAAGQIFSYDLDHIGRYWRDAARLLDDARARWPDHVVRIDHEALLDAPEASLRALLAWLGLPFEPACLDFHRSDRAVRTASAQQVRRPLNRDGQGRWRVHRARLGPLFTALGLPADGGD